jgi:hypothetical protein
MDSLGARTFVASAGARLGRAPVSTLAGDERPGRAEKFGAAVARVRDRAHAG